MSETCTITEEDAANVKFRGQGKAVQW